MSHTVDLIVGPLSEKNKKAWEEIEALRESYYDDQREKAPPSSLYIPRLPRAIPVCAATQMTTLRWKSARGQMAP